MSVTVAGMVALDKLALTATVVVAVPGQVDILVPGGPEDLAIEKMEVQVVGAVAEVVGQEKVAEV